MSQQINLFNPIFLKKKKYLSAVTMAQALGLILLGTILFSVYAEYQLSSLSSQATATSAQLKTAQAQLAKVNSTYVTHQKSKQLEAEVQKAETGLRQQQQVFNAVQAGAFGNRQGYSEYFRAFSRQIVNGLWLTGFTIYGAGAEIQIQGRALQPALVPAYITRLKQEPALQGKSFSTLEMQVPQVERAVKDDAAGGKQIGPTPYIEFSLQSSGLAAAKADSHGEKSK